MRTFVEKSQEPKKVFDTTSITHSVSPAEIHHRIKNNLNTIASILGLQINTLDAISEKNTKKILENSKQRIETIAMNHQSLYQNHDTGKVTFKSYARNLIDMINKSCNRNISAQIASQNISLPTEIMFLMGIIISELFTNSLKHAFKKDEDDGQVLISLIPYKNHFIFNYHEYRSDDIDTDKILKSQTLGMRLIKLTVKQLDGTMDVIQNRGLTFTIEF